MIKKFKVNSPYDGHLIKELELEDEISSIRKPRDRI